MGIQPTWNDRANTPFTATQVFANQDATDLSENAAFLWYAFALRHSSGGTSTDGEHLDAGVPICEGTAQFTGSFGSGGSFSLEDGVGPSLTVAGGAVLGVGQVNFAAAQGILFPFFTPRATPETVLSDDYGAQVWQIIPTAVNGGSVPFIAISTPTDATIAWTATSNGCVFAFALHSKST